MASEATGLSGIAGRYAAALYDLADADNALDAVAGDLRDIAAMIAASGDLARLIRSPLLDRQDQSRGMVAVLESAGVGDLTRRFVGVVARNRRLFALPAIIDAYLDLLATRRGEVKAEVSAAQNLSERQIDDLTAALKTAVGANVVIETKVEPDLIGGLVVRVGSRMFDTSIRTKLERLQLAMKGAG